MSISGDLPGRLMILSSMHLLLHLVSGVIGTGWFLVFFFGLCCFDSLPLIGLFYNKYVLSVRFATAFEQMEISATHAGAE